MSPEALFTAAKNYACPKCKAEPGQDCQTPKGRKASPPHSERIHACVQQTGWTPYQFPVDVLPTGDPDSLDLLASETFIGKVESHLRKLRQLLDNDPQFRAQVAEEAGNPADIADLFSDELKTLDRLRARLRGADRILQRSRQRMIPLKKKN